MGHVQRDHDHEQESKAQADGCNGKNVSAKAQKGITPEDRPPVLVVAFLSVATWKLWPRTQAPKAAEQRPVEANATRASKSVFNQPTTFLELCDTPTEQLEKCDIALMNLLCAEGLPGAENLNVRETLERLTGIAKGVKFETDRHVYKFRQHPEEFNHSEGYYRMMMATVLQQDLGIHYNPERIEMPNQPLEPKFFANSQDVFIHGLARKNGTGTVLFDANFLRPGGAEAWLPTQTSFQKKMLTMVRRI